MNWKRKTVTWKLKRLWLGVLLLLACAIAGGCTCWNRFSDQHVERRHVDFSRPEAQKREVDLIFARLAGARLASLDTGKGRWASTEDRLLVARYLVQPFRLSALWVYPGSEERPVGQHGHAYGFPGPVGPSRWFPLSFLFSYEDLHLFDVKSRKPLQSRRDSSILLGLIWYRAHEAWPAAWNEVHARQRRWSTPLWASKGVAPVNDRLLLDRAPYHERSCWIVLGGVLGGGRVNGRRYVQILWIPISLGASP